MGSPVSNFYEATCKFLFASAQLFQAELLCSLHKQKMLKKIFERLRLGE